MEKTTKIKAGKPICAFGISFAVFVICAILVNLTTTAGGTIKNRHITFSYSDYNGSNYKDYSGDAILMIPENATEKNPAPGVVIFHGNSSQAHSMATLATELARRGYAVILPNLPGAGYSDQVGSEPSITADTGTYIDTLYYQIEALNYIQKGNLTAFGFSSGTRAAAYIACNHKDAFNTVVWGSSLIPINTVGGWGKEWDMEGLNLVQISTKECGVPPVVEGDFLDNTARVTYNLSKFQLHTFMMYSEEEIRTLIHYIGQANPAPTQLAENNMAFMWPEYISLIGFAALTALMVTLPLVLMQTDFFQTLNNTQYKAFPEEKKQWKFGKAIISIVVSFLIMYIFVIRLEIIPRDTGIPAIPLWFNVYIPYFVGVAILQFILFYIFHRKIGKENGGSLAIYGIAWENGYETAKNIAKAILLAALTAGFALACLYVMEMVFCVSFHFEFFSLNTTQPYNLIHAWFYIVMYVVLFVGVNLNDSIAKTPRNTGHPVADTAVDCIISSIIALVPILIVVAINIARGMHILPGNTNMPADHLVGYPFIIVMTTVINTVLNRKTKRPWVGATVSAIFCGFMLVCNYSLQSTLFG